MNYDYDPKIKSAQEKIERYGRYVTFIKLSGAAADPDKPWKGAGLPVEEFSRIVKAVFVPVGDSSFSPTMFGENIIDSELLKSADQVALVAASDKPLEEAHLCIDMGVKKGIEWCRPLRPGDKVVLYFFGIKE